MIRFSEIIIGIFLSLTIAFTGVAQTSDTLPDAILWKISGKNIKTPSYLLGTIHTIPKKDFFFTENMLFAFNSCKELVLEANYEFSSEMQKKMMQFMMLPDGKTLRDYMDKKTYERYIAFLHDSLNVSPLSLLIIPKIKPVFTLTLILNDNFEQVLFEEYLKNLAIKNNMKISGLESMKDQMDALDAIPVEEQIMTISDTSKYSKQDLTEYRQMIDLYKNQKLNELGLMEKDEEIILKYSDRIVTNRNKHWVSVLKKKLKKQACFIAVGIGHLPGTKGLILLLRKAGYTVTPVKI